jgi:hypothetical protein
MNYIYSVRFSSAKSTSKLNKSAVKNDMNIIIKLAKKTHEVNMQKGKVLNKLLKGTGSRGLFNILCIQYADLI